MPRAGQFGVSSHQVRNSTFPPASFIQIFWPISEACSSEIVIPAGAGEAEARQAESKADTKRGSNVRMGPVYNFLISAICGTKCLIWHGTFAAHRGVEGPYGDGAATRIMAC